MHSLSRDINAYVRNMRRSAISDLARRQLAKRPAESETPVVMQPYAYGIEQSSPIAPIGQAVDPETGR